MHARPHSSLHLQVSVLTFETFGCAKEIRNVGPTAHFQLFRYPFEAHSRFFSQTTRQLYLFRRSFPLGFQIRYLPADLGQGRGDESAGIGFASFTPVTAIMIGSDTLGGSRQEFFPSNTPAAPPVLPKPPFNCGITTCWVSSVAEPPGITFNPKPIRSLDGFFHSTNYESPNKLDIG